MTNRQELEESLTSWRESAEHDKKNLKLSALIGGMGLTLTGVGIVGVVAGIPLEGSMAIGVGGTLAYMGAQEARDDLRTLLESQRVVAQRELQIKEEA